MKYTALVGGVLNHEKNNSFEFYVSIVAVCFRGEYIYGQSG